MPRDYPASVGSCKVIIPGMAESRNAVLVLKGANIAAYGFGDGHPFGPDRHAAFHDELAGRDFSRVIRLAMASEATHAELTAFHTPGHVARVEALCREGTGWLDGGDTPAQRGLDAAAAAVVGATVFAMESIMARQARRAFVPIAGLHHAGRDNAAGFCVYNDCGVVIELLRARHGLSRIAYVDIDAHHGDGVFYPFESDPTVIYADIHEDGRYNFPQSGFPHEIGKGAAKGRKLNIPLLPLSADPDFLMMWDKVEAFVRQWKPQFIVMNCGADGLDGDPLAHLHYTYRAHARAAGHRGHRSRRPRSSAHGVPAGDEEPL